jgi:hypothetical protein
VPTSHKPKEGLPPPDRPADAQIALQIAVRNTSRTTICIVVTDNFINGVDQLQIQPPPGLFRLHGLSLADSKSHEICNNSRHAQFDGNRPALIPLFGNLTNSLSGSW